MTWLNTKLAGVSFRPEEARLAFYAVGAHEELRLEPEPTNAYDANAVKVFAGEHHVGYIPKADAPLVKAWLGDDGCVVRCLKVADRGNALRVERGEAAADERQASA